VEDVAYPNLASSHFTELSIVFMRNFLDNEIRSGL